MTTELAYQSRRAEDIMHKNTELLDDNKRLRSENSMLEQQVEELVKRSHLMHRIVHGLREEKDEEHDKLQKLTVALQSSMDAKEIGKLARQTGAFDISDAEKEEDAVKAESEHDSGKWFHTGMFGASRPSTSKEVTASSHTSSKPAKLVPAALHAANEALKKRLTEMESALGKTQAQLEMAKMAKRAQDEATDQTMQFLLRAARDTSDEMKQVHNVSLPDLLVEAAANKDLRAAAVQSLLNKLSIHMESLTLRSAVPNGSSKSAAGGRRRAAAAATTESLPPLTKPYTRADLFSSLSSMSLPKSVLSMQSLG